MHCVDMHLSLGSSLYYVSCFDSGVLLIQPFRLSQEEIENLNVAIITMEIELVMKNLTTKKIPETDDFTGELYQMFKEDSISIIHKFFKQTEEEETFLKLTL